jgi:hypothetical protein
MPSVTPQIHKESLGDEYARFPDQMYKIPQSSGDSMIVQVISEPFVSGGFFTLGSSKENLSNIPSDPGFRTFWYNAFVAYDPHCAPALLEAMPDRISVNLNSGMAIMSSGQLVPNKVSRLNAFLASALNPHSTSARISRALSAIGGGFLLGSLLGRFGAVCGLLLGFISFVASESHHK